MPSKKRHDLLGHQFGRYQIAESIIQRDLVTLYLAHHDREGLPVFLLLLNATAEEDPELSERFRRRLETVALLKHVNAAPIIETSSSKAEHVYAVMEFFQHELLSDRIHRQNKANQRMASVEALLLIRQIADALAAAHPVGLIHYDLRPENILIKGENTPVLIDLGMPTVINSENGGGNKPVSALIDYASPEQLQGKALSGRSNIYSLGVMLYELLAGERPRLPISEWDIFERDADTLPREIPLESVRSGLSPQTYQMVGECLWRPEWNRFETIDNLLAAIDLAISAEDAEPAPKRPAPATRPWLWMILVLVIVLLILATFWLLTS